MKKIIYLLLLFFFPAQLFAGDVGTLVVNLRDGTSASFALSDKPRITFSGASMSIVSAGSDAEFVRTDVKNYVFNDLATSIDNALEGEATVLADACGVTLSGLPCGTPVAVYSVGGQCVARDSADNDGRCTLSFGDLPRGIYIINYNSTTIKYLKK